MTNKLSYIKKAVNYMIGGVVLAANLSSTTFGVPKEDNKACLGSSLGESEVALSQSFREDEAALEISLGESEAIGDKKKIKMDYYLINNADELKEFVDKVNSGEYNAKGKLMKDIEINEGGVVENGKLKAGNFKEWIPIGTEEHPFEGEFEGNEKIISGLYIKTNKNNQGLFGVIGKGGKVRNIGINRSYIEAINLVGGIAGKNKGKITNCITDDNIMIGKYCVGGNIGINEGTINESLNKGGMVEGNKGVGGNIGYNNSEGILDIIIMREK